MSYAEGTQVPVDRTQAEIRRTLEKYGAAGFAFGQQIGAGVVMFEMKDRRIRMGVPIPIAGKDRGAGKNNYVHSKDTAAREERRRWRCLLIAIKAKLECVDSGISTLEEEFLAHIVLPGGQTVGARVLPQIDKSYRDGKMPPLLGYDS